MEERPKRILIIEDDRSLRTASEIALKRAGYTVLTAADGREGLAILKADVPDLIVLDLLMPSPTGLDVLRTLRADERTRKVPVIVMSNSSMQRIIDEVGSLGAEYVAKATLSLRDLRDRVNRRLGNDTRAVAAPPSPSALPRPPAPGDRAATPARVEAAGSRATAAAQSPRPTVPSSDIRCAGCGSSIGSRFTFCPHCGRKLASPDSVTAVERRIR